MTQTSSVMRFLEPWDKKENPYIRTAPDEGFDHMNFGWVDCPVTITDARPEKSDFSLDVHGFAFRDDPEGSTPEMLDILRRNDREMIVKYYYPHIEQIIKQETKASRVVIFDHTIRRRQPELGATDNPEGREQPATMVHCDQSTLGAYRRIEQHTGEDFKVLSKGRVQLLNLWRPLRGPVEDWPLAVMDYRSIDTRNMHDTDLWKNQFERRGQTVTFSYFEGQKWYYLDGHRTDEVTCIKIWDSKDNIEGKLCAHAAFKHPRTPPNAEPRESIEVRVLVIHDPENGEA